MDDLKKLKHLLYHWMEHNDEHAKTYSQWSEKALAAGNKELSGVLERLSNETKEMKRLFEKAINAI